MKYKGILFDFDGTIADTLPLCFFAFKEVFREYDLRELSTEDVIGMFGPSETGIIQRHLNDSDRIMDAIEDYYAHYDNAHEEHVRFDPRMLELLDELASAGYRLGIFTGKGRRSYDISMNRLGLERYFNESITGDDVLNPKPDPEGITKALEAMQLDISEAIFVGDSNADIVSGVRAGIDTIAVSWFAGSHNDFIQTPTHYCRELNDFMKLIRVNGN